MPVCLRLQIVRVYANDACGVPESNDTSYLVISAALPFEGYAFPVDVLTCQR